MRSGLSISKVFTGCCASAFLMEIIVLMDSQSTNLVTFLQFLFTSLYGFIFISKFGTVKPKIPIKQYSKLVALFFVSSVANNYVYALHVPSTLHMIIRSASSPASMVVYCIAKKQLPKVNSAVGSILISVGVALAMYGGAPTEQNKGELIWWCVGVSVLLATLVTGALTGLQQELMYAKYGKHPDELLFYTYALPMPVFLALSPQLVSKAANLQTNIWTLIIMSILSQFYCTYAVHELATRETTVTVTFILTLRKFISLMISVLVFKSNFTVLHLIGTVFVAVGTYVYFDCFQSKKQEPVRLKTD